MRFLAENELSVLLKAIKMARIDGMKSVEVSMEDLSIMVEHIEDLEGNLEEFDGVMGEHEALVAEIGKLEAKVKDLLMKNIQCTINALDRPMKLDVWA